LRVLPFFQAPWQQLHDVGEGCHPIQNEETLTALSDALKAVGKANPVGRVQVAEFVFQKAHLSS
jgi:hypothetical protein